jgi:hypothetical protein
MAFWFGKKKQAELREVTLPGDVGTISFPADFAIELEDDTTLKAQPEGDDAIIFRVSSISCVKKGEYPETIGKDSVRRRADEQRLPFWEIGDKGILSYETPSEHEGEPLVMKYWHIGSKSTLVILSATITVSRKDAKVVQDALGLIPRILESLEITKVRHVIVAEDREVETVTTTVEPIPQQVVPFGPTENSWRKQSLESARAMGVKYGSGGDLTPEELDVVFSRWMHDEEEKEADDLVADALGAAFGEYFVEQHGFRWVVLTDKYGTEYAVRHSLGENTAFPRASVQKRIEDRCPEFFQNVYLIVLDQLMRSAEEQKSS